MKINRLGLVAMGTVALLSSCNNDDDGGGTVELRDPVEVASENDADLKEFLSTHFYNYEEFDAAADNPDSTDFDFKIVIDTIAGENSNKKSLMEQIATKTFTIDIPEGLTSEQETVDFTLYYLVAREGDDIAPQNTDSTLVRYRGAYLNSTPFDATNTPVWSYLGRKGTNNLGEELFIYGQSVREFMPELKSGGEIIENEDGTVTTTGNYGIGAAFFPASSSPYGIGPFTLGQQPASYTPVMYTVDLLRVREVEEEEED